MANRAARVQQQGSMQQFVVQLSQSLPKQVFYSSGSSLLSNSSQVLQQLQDAIDTRGVYASLPTTAESFNPATSQTLFKTASAAAPFLKVW